MSKGKLNYCWLLSKPPKSEWKAPSFKSVCCICGDIALYRVNMDGFCKLHKGDAVKRRQVHRLRQEDKL